MFTMGIAIVCRKQCRMLLYLTISEGGINCNKIGSITYTGVCGGFGAYMNNSEVYDGLDFGRDYCLSGEFSRGRRGHNTR